MPSRNVTEDGRSPFGEWLGGLKGRRAQARILARLDRVQLGNLGDWKSLSGAGAWPSCATPTAPATGSMSRSSTSA
ncbi:MAG: hypothetical protein WAS21_21780 [Geminicoccaceae bacterium]